MHCFTFIKYLKKNFRLSRLSGEPIFEEKAKTAMDVLWSSRHRQSNLVGNVLNINTGDWIRRDSGVGAGIDSYYEYVAKAYVLLGDEQYLSRWNTHYSSIMKYLGQVSTIIELRKALLLLFHLILCTLHNF